MFINGREFLIGADPEVFLKRKEEKEKWFWCAEGIIPGTKKHPFKVSRGAVQVDGFAAEFNINPVKTPKGFVSNIKAVLGGLKAMVEPQGFDIYATPVAFFEHDHYEKAPKHAKDLGCNADWNAYSEAANPTPQPPDDLFRTGAGHVHIGWGKDFNIDDPNLIEACIHLTKHMDACVGKPLSMVSHDWKRRELYGDFGCFRPTTYGVEYRTPSNSWLHSKEHVEWVAKQTFLAVEKSFSTKSYDYNVDQAPEMNEVQKMMEHDFKVGDEVRFIDTVGVTI